jgi:glycosyltransferase involved in cell wall biosynthesis
MPTLSVIVPYFNESRILPRLFEALNGLPQGLVHEFLFVDDGSSDNSRELVQNFKSTTEHNVKSLKNDVNMGKGVAIKTGIEAALGSHSIILDADLELDPSEIESLFNPILEGKAKVVLGYRTFTSQSSFTYRYVMGNKAITNFYGILFNSYIRDIMCGYKLLPTDLWKKIDLHQHGFAVEVEIPAACLHYGFKPFEVPVSYYPRTREAGKGITAVDGLKIFIKLAIMRIRLKPNL